MHLAEFIHIKSYEKVVYEVRRHPITLLPTFLAFLSLLILPIILFFVLQNVWTTLLSGLVSYPLTVLLGSIFYLSVGLFFYTYFVTFYLDILVVTNDRLLLVEQHGLFSRTVSELDLYQIQDITSEVHGFFASSFNYGNLSIQTAAATVKFHIENVPQPDTLRREILDLAEEDRKHHTTIAHPAAPTTPTPAPHP